ncbi:MAG: amino acid adenylation domain-containing protein, partial [Acidobacteria bacterium]|nr:amino acid adenylation domain-containing protein [Acidobacteriota bacterium]
QYGDFAVWQRGWLAGEALARQLAYWRQRLAGAPALLSLPTDRQRPATQSYRGAQRSLELPAPLAGRLRELGRRHGTTLFMTLLAAWGVQLARLTGGEDLPIGTPIANRNRREIEPLIGFFANTLVLRLDLSGDPTCGELLGRVRELTLDAHAHQDLPFEKLVEELRPERALSHSPLFQAMFVLQRQEDLALALPGIAAVPVRLAGETAKFDLGLAAAAGPGLALSLEVNRDLFDGATAARMLGGLAVLLEQLAGAVPGSERRAGELSLLAAGERHQLLAEWNDTGGADRGAAADLALHRLFELQALRTPEAVAVIGGSDASAGGGLGFISYGELARRAGSLARRLAELGVGPEVRVGVALERTPELVVALLAILKAGGAYVPLDPGYPRERLAFILADAQQGIADPLLLTEETLRDRLPDFHGRVLCLDAGGGPEPGDGARAGETVRRGTFAVPPDSLAYVIYTSGSTGRPKGVAITHRSAVTLLRWAGELYSPAELARVLAATSITFDLSVFELFLPLARGGTVVIAENALALLTLPAGAAPTLINTVPSAMAELLRLGGVPATVTTVNLAGEPLKRSLTDKIHADLPGVRRIYNLYGPSEDTTYSTFVRVGGTVMGATAADAGREPTIGRPIAGTRAHVLDRRMQPLPAGVPGELCLGGGGLARGYLARPELTAQSFVPDPFGAAGERLYRTGDLVRHLGDGELEFLGRIDHQVKLRGFRIELGEIETALLAHPRVREAVTVAREDIPGRRRLVAYCVLAAGAEAPPSTAALAADLRQRLPDYMVPEAWVLLDALPLTANGKVDRRALPAPELRRPAGDDEHAAFAAPRNPIEELVAGIWSEVLGVEPIGIHDRFFDLGGHSLLATQVISRLRHALGIEVPLRALFEAPVLADLAARVAAASAAAAGGGPAAGAPPIARQPRERPLPASFGQERLWFLDRLGAGGPAYNLPSVLRLRGELAWPALAAALAALVRRHESLRTTFAAAGGQVVQVVAPAGAVPLPVVELAALPGAAREAEGRRLATAAACRSFALERGPLLRATLLRLGAGEHVLLLALHHVVSDGWSQGVMLAELGKLYAMFAGFAGGVGFAPSAPFAGFVPAASSASLA